MLEKHTYSIGEIASMMQVNTATIRYWESEGLLPDIKRVNGVRVFQDKDFRWLRVLNCLKNTNMPIKKIKEYVDLTKLGDKTLDQRLQLIEEQKQNTLDQIEKLQYFLQEIEYKLWYYNQALQAGTEEAVKDCAVRNPTLAVDRIPKTAKGDL